VLDELTKNVRGKMGRSGTLATSEAFQQQYAKAEGTYRAARALVYESWADVGQSLGRGEPLSTRQHTLIRLAMAHATWSAHEVAMFAYSSAGTVALRSGTLQRLFRDMHAGIQHVTSSPPVFQAIGRDLAGLAPNAEWKFLDLVPGNPPT
jgi:alkylation response protein AidB-like acyl-CoA dehydrogenase